MHRLVRALVTLALAAPVVVVVTIPARAAFPGRNGLIAWSKISFCCDSEIWVMDPNGSNQRVFTNNDREDMFPAWSADGRKLAYSSFDDATSDSDVWVIDADGAGEHDVTNDLQNADLQPAWSPDRSRIAFVKQSSDGTTAALWVMDADGSNQTPLTDATALNYFPSWSPDGTEIAFVSSRDGNFELYTIAPDGTDLRRLTFTPTQQESDPNWSPDGGRLAFEACVSPHHPCRGGPNQEIFAMRADGSARRRLTNEPSRDLNPAWSPDGTQIVFVSNRSPEGTELWKMKADGSNVVQLTFEPYQGGVDPDWQPRP